MANILVNPYVIQEVGTKISISPTQLDFNLYKNLKNNLIKKVEGKNIKIGNVVRVHKITEYGNGYIDPNSFMGNALYDIKYIATLCVPIELKQIIVRIDMRSDADKGVNTKDFKALRCSNGCIDCIVMVNLIDIQKFRMNVDGTIEYIKTNAVLMNGDYLKVTIQNKQINANTNRIMIIGYLNDVASEEEVQQYYDVPSDLQMQQESNLENVEIFE
jgi:DNA-directed RNA polymerase subunit E'/Rpb7